jgi:hypothetical protein
VEALLRRLAVPAIIRLRVTGVPSLLGYPGSQRQQAAQGLQRVHGVGLTHCCATRARGGLCSVLPYARLRYAAGTRGEWQRTSSTLDIGTSRWPTLLECFELCLSCVCRVGH